ncbi:IVNS1ABP [Lepeophtheirus salmonis]|uniref:Kelch-like protein diablo n=1 Tax=Lepeophtheirus salmonis TaxID=72036 RepID=A0A7R8CFI2_LEPSM|nr:IVNS1ABP [Lepeophtheirus salmonis]CAF2800873.1 IVNS1ABP [Lepeophtheirus salmonis]
MRLILERRLLDHSKMVSEDDDALLELSVIPNLIWTDDNVHDSTLSALNQMRKNKHFCDVTLQVGKQDFPSHRAVLAAVSPYLFELFTAKEDQPTVKEAGHGIIYKLNGGFDKYALEKLIEYAYTGCLNVPGEKNHSHLTTCFETRALTGIICSKLSSDLLSKVDKFIADNLMALRESRELRSLPRICLEILHNSKEGLESALVPNLCQLCLIWIHQQWNEDECLTIEDLTSKDYLLFIAEDNTLQDCDLIGEDSQINSERIQDYKKSNHTSKAKKSPRIYSVKPSKAKELLYTRHINQDEVKTEERSEDWKLIALNGSLATLSIIQRINTPTKTLSEFNLSVHQQKHTSPRISRPPSVDKDDFTPVAVMNEAKCAVGGCCLDGKLIILWYLIIQLICGYDRGECLNRVESYNPISNRWTSLEPMLTKRGRFGITTLNGCIYAVGGSNGSTELSSVEKYDKRTKKWSVIASLPIGISNNGVCTFGDRVYCIGGLYGQSGTKFCYALNEEQTQWNKICSLNIGRSQTAVTVFQDKIWVVGGCDSWAPLNYVEIYDPITNLWQFGPPLMSPRRGCGLTAKDGLLYAIGGSDGTRSLCTTENKCLDRSCWKFHLGNWGFLSDDEEANESSSSDPMSNRDTSSTPAPHNNQSSSVHFDI